MTHWILPYKQIVLDNGLLVIYEQELELSAESAPLLHVIRIGNHYFTQINQKHLVMLDAAAFDCLVATKRIVLAVSEMTDVSGTMIGCFEIDALSLGRILAHLEAHANTIESNPDTADVH